MRMSRILVKIGNDEPALATTLHLTDPSIFELVALMGEKVAGIGDCIAKEVKKIAVERVRARLGDNVHRRSGANTVVCGKSTSLNAELL